MCFLAFEDMLLVPNPVLLQRGTVAALNDKSVYCGDEQPREIYWVLTEPSEREAGQARPPSKSCRARAVVQGVCARQLRSRSDCRRRMFPGLKSVGW